MLSKRSEWSIRGGILLAVFLPLAFNPFADEPFEVTKVILFQAVTAGMTFMALIQLISFQADPAPQMRAWLSAAWQRIGLPAAPITLYVAVLILATLASIDVGLSVWGSGDRHGTLTTLLAIMFFLMLLTALDEWVHIDRIHTAIIVGSVPVAFYGWIQYLGLDVLSWISFSISPVHSTLGRSVFLGAYLAMVFPFTLARFLSAHRDRQHFRLAAHLVLLLIQLGCLIVTLARGAWLGFLGAILLFIAILLKQRRRAILSIMVLLIVGMVVFAIIVQFGGEIFPESASTPSGDRFTLIRSWSNQARLITWRDAVTLIQQRWLLGFGPETYAKAVDQAGLINPASETAWMHQDDPHNLWLFQLTAVGIGGLLAYLWLGVRYYRAILAAIDARVDAEQELVLAAVLASTTAYFIQAQFNPDVITLIIFFWMVLALGFAAARLAMRENP